MKDENKGKAQNEKGMLSSFEAISTAIGGTVGFGNIAGVATAVAAGGPGAVVWMWLTSLIGMILKQVEVTLGCYYRREHENGDFYGGPTYYMERGLGKERHWGKIMADSGADLRSWYFLHILCYIFYSDSSTGCIRRIPSGEPILLPEFRLRALF